MAMAALTLDHLSGGRFILGLGASGPQVAEGWYGDDYRKPLARTREYVDIVRQVLAREEPVEFQGDRYQLPLPGRHRLRQAVEVDHAPVARRSADLPRGRRPEERRRSRPRSPTAGCRCSTRPALDGFYRDALAEGFARPGARHTPTTFEVACLVPIIVARRRRSGRQLLPADARALHRRHGRARGELPQQRVRAHGLRGRGEAHPGPLPRRQEGRGRGRGADPARRGRRADRSEGEDPRRPRDVARVDGHDDDRVGRDRTARDRSRSSCSG